MTETFKVQWQDVFRSLTIFMSVALIVGISLTMGVRLISLRFDFAKTFEHMSLTVFLLLLLGIPIFSGAFAFLVAQWFRLAGITISEEAIHGRNFWGCRNTIPLADITKLTPFSNNGINAIVVHSRHHGQVYISDKTERLNELLEILEPHLSHNSQCP